MTWGSFSGVFLCLRRSRVVFLGRTNRVPPRSFLVSGLYLESGVWYEDGEFTTLRILDVGDREHNWWFKLPINGYNLHYSRYRRTKLNGFARYQLCLI
jgi:hypothetical protein